VQTSTLKNTSPQFCWHLYLFPRQLTTCKWLVFREIARNVHKCATVLFSLLSQNR
jgi:hypothetical protein